MGWGPLIRITRSQLILGYRRMVIEKSFINFQSNFLNDNHARISNEDAAVFDPFLEVLLKANNVVEEQGEKSAVTKISHYVT